MTALLWLRRDLRLHDHPALRAALDSGGPVVPVFCLDLRLLGGRHASGPRTQFALECLADLGASLRRRGSGLVVRHGRPGQVLAELARGLEANRVFWSGDVSPFATWRDQAVRRELEALGAEVRVLPGLFVLDDPEALLTSAGDPYRVFTPFHRAWLKRARREVLPAPRSFPALPRAAEPGTLPTPMARNLLTAGFHVRVWNRTPDKARVLAAKGADLAETPADAVREGAFVITMLTDATASWRW